MLACNMRMLDRMHALLRRCALALCIAVDLLCNDPPSGMHSVTDRLHVPEHLWSSTCTPPRLACSWPMALAVECGPCERSPLY